MNYIGKFPSVEEDRLKIERENRLAAAKQTDAIWAMEGFKPDPAFKAMQDKLVAGEISADEMAAALVEQYRQNG